MRRYGSLSLCAALLALPAALAGQARCRQGVEPARVAVVAGGFALGQVALIAARHDDWWTTPGTAFHLRSGGSPSRGQDLLLHGFAAYQTAQLGRLLFDWACVPPGTAAWLGTALGVAAGLPKEIGDGLHAQKGFALDDFGVSAVAAVLPAVHRAWPASRAASLEALYWPSAEYRNRQPGGLPQLENDYAGQRYYLAIHPGALPGGAGAWPDWLGVAVGHGVPQWASAPPSHDWYAGLDLRLAGLPIRGALWRRLAPVLDQIHLPWPGLRIRGGTVTFGLY